jgi:hypothetical protein
MSILRHKCIPMLACNLFRIFDLIKQEQETFRLIVFLSDYRKQQLYSVNKIYSFIYLFIYCNF